VTFSEKVNIFFFPLCNSIRGHTVYEKEKWFVLLGILGVSGGLSVFGGVGLLEGSVGSWGWCRFLDILSGPGGPRGILGPETRRQNRITKKKWREIPGRESMCWASPGVTWPRVLNPLSNSWRFSDSSM
jgi:hypothetical protein